MDKDDFIIGVEFLKDILHEKECPGLCYALTVIPGDDLTIDDDTFYDIMDYVDTKLVERYSTTEHIWYYPTSAHGLNKKWIKIKKSECFFNGFYWEPYKPEERIEFLNELIKQF